MPLTNPVEIRSSLFTKLLDRLLTLIGLAAHRRLGYMTAVGRRVERLRKTVVMVTMITAGCAYIVLEVSVARFCYDLPFTAYAREARRDVILVSIDDKTFADGSRFKRGSEGGLDREDLLRVL